MRGKYHHAQNLDYLLMSTTGYSTGRWDYTGANAWGSKADDDNEDFTAQGYVPDIYVAFVAYGMKWGSHFSEPEVRA